jgi:hypothetical protein
MSEEVNGKRLTVIVARNEKGEPITEGANLTPYEAVVLKILKETNIDIQKIKAKLGIS